MCAPGGDGTQYDDQAAERVAQQEVGQSPALATTNLRFLPPRNFSGKEEDWDLFQYKFKAYMNLAHINFSGLVKLAQEAGSTPITFDIGIDDDEIALSNILQNALISLCDGPAARIVQRQAELGNGADSWRALCNIYSTSTRSRATGRMTNILQW